MDGIAKIVQQGYYDVAQVPSIAFNGSFKFKSLPDGHDGHAMSGQVAADDDPIVCFYSAVIDMCFGMQLADPAGVDENFIALASFHHFGITGDDLNFRPFSRARC